MNEFCFVALIILAQTGTAYFQRWSYIPIPAHARYVFNNNAYNVAGWAASPTTEPPLGPNDRMNTTDVPEEIEARPDKTRAQRRQLLKRMNPGFTNQQIEAQLLRDDKARAKMAATQSEPVVILPEPVTPATRPPPAVTPTPKPKPKPQPKPKQTQQVNKHQLWRSANARQIQQVKKHKLWTPSSAGKFGAIAPVNKPQQRRPRPQQRVNAARNSRRRRPRPTTTTTTEPLPTTYPTYPTTGYQYIPTTYPTPAYQYNDPIVTNAPMRRGPPQRQQPMRRQQGPRRNNRQRPRPRPRIGRRQRNRARNGEEEFRPRDPLSRWIYNNIEGEVLETFLPFLAFG
ncbi:serine/arginine repetitive matrix protein 1-like [Mercenaria mercenaria]|uniref:serine/arginine repetitive matrix protein 1-like n=1 Tax=Mercenaria mercenaria TaxID=6596 RepID=UPI00234EEAD2|nr:serine/arginine repetitive matrix protein 1-like [Mercenaria mercenaria]